LRDALSEITQALAQNKTQIHSPIQNPCFDDSHPSVSADVLPEMIRERSETRGLLWMATDVITFVITFANEKENAFWLARPEGLEYRIEPAPEQTASTWLLEADETFFFQEDPTKWPEFIYPQIQSRRFFGLETPSIRIS
jgi:hypothetical protein